MILKSSFFKMLKQERKTNFWYPLIVFVYFFLILEVQLLMRIQEMERWPNRYDYSIKHYFANYYLAIDSNLLMTISSCIVGCISALLVFSYIQSRKKLDMIHSLPVKRGTIFGANYMAGVSYFVFPMIIHTVLIILIASFKGCMSGHGIKDLIAFMCCQGLFYLLTYTMTILAIMLTGNFIVSILATAVLQCYSFFILLLKSELYYEFYHTAVIGHLKPVFAFSPVHMIVNMCGKFDEYRNINTGISYQIVVGYAFVILLAVLIFGTISFFLYRYRSTEAAGRAIAFPKLEPLIKCMLCIPISLFVGLLFFDFSSTSSFAWMIFGMCFSFIMFCIFMEMIFRMDVRAGLKHWYHILYNGVCVCLILAIFKMDVLGFDTYVPAREEISYISTSLDDFMYISMYGERYIQDRDISNFRMQNVKLTDDATYQFVNKLAKDSLKYSDMVNSQAALDSEEYEKLLKEEANYHPITVCYHLKNGKEEYRRYLYDLTDQASRQAVENMFNSREYKLGSMPILKNGWYKEVDSLKCYTSFSEETFTLTEAEKNQLLNAYQSDIMGLSFEEALEIRPIAMLEITYLSNSKEYYESGYQVFDSFTKTKTLLEEFGIKLVDEDFQGNISNVTITYYDYENENFPEINITDAEKIAEILEYAISYSLTNGFRYIHNDYDIDIDIEYFNELGHKNYRYMYFYNNRVPKFVLEELGL